MAKPDATASEFVLPDHVAGALAYVTFIPAILFLALEHYKHNSYIRYHAWQSILLSLAAFAVNIVVAFVLVFALLFSPTLHVFVWRAVVLFWMAVWVACAVNAVMGKRFRLPVIGRLAEQQSGG